MPTQNQPAVSVLERLRQAINSPAHLRRARECWWQSQQAVCLVNQAWDDQTNEVIAPQVKRAGRESSKQRSLMRNAIGPFCNWKGLMSLWRLSYDHRESPSPF